MMLVHLDRGYTDIDQEHKNKTIWNGSSSEVIQVQVNQNKALWLWFSKFLEVQPK